MTPPELHSAKIKFGKNAKKIKKEKGLSYREASYNCSLTHSRIQEIEKGMFDIRLSTILELAKGLEVPPSKLMDF